MGNKFIKGVVVFFAGCVFASTGSYGAVTESWTTETTEIGGHNFSAYHGETVLMKCTMLENGRRINPFPIAGSQFLWQTNGMGNLWWQTNATVSSGLVSSRFTPEMDVGNDSVSYFFNVQDRNGGNYRANGKINLLASPAGDMRYLPLPTKAIDFAQVTVENADKSPFALKGEAGKVDYKTVTNIAEYVVSTNGFLKEHQSLADYRKKSETVPWSDVSGAPDFAKTTDLADYRKKSETVPWSDVSGAPDFAKTTDLADYRKKSETVPWSDVSGHGDFVTETITNGLATTESIAPTVTNTVTREYVNNLGVGTEKVDYVKVTNIAESVVADQHFLKTHQSLAVTNEYQHLLPYPTNAIPSTAISGEIERGVSASAVTGIVESANVFNGGAMSYLTAEASLKEDLANKATNINAFVVFDEELYPTARAAYDYARDSALVLADHDEFTLNTESDYQNAIKEIIDALGGTRAGPAMKISLTTSSAGTSVTVGPTTFTSSSLDIAWGDGSTNTYNRQSGALTVSHTYSTAGDYTIEEKGSITSISGSGTSSSYVSGDGVSVAKLEMNIRDVSASSGVKIGSYAFSNANIEEFVVADNVTEISDYAFYGNRNLKKVTIRGNALKKIGKSAFHGCVNLKSINIPDSVWYIGVQAFCNTAITSFITPNSLADSYPNGYHSFQYCTNLTTVGFNAPFTATTDCGNMMFDSCLNLKNVYFGSKCKHLGTTMFVDCTSLTSIVIPASIETTGLNPFYRCTNICSVVFKEPSSLKVYNGLFDCSALTELNFPSSIEEVSYIRSMPNLERISFYDLGRVKTFGRVYDCPKMKTVDFPDSVECLDGTYNGDSSLTNYYMLPKYVKVLDQTYCSNTNIYNYEVSNTICKLSESFMNCSSLTNVMFAADSCLTNIYYAFYNCPKLKKVNLPEHLEDIGFSSFYGCTQLGEVTMSNKVVTIGNNAFASCSSLTNVLLSSTLKTLGSWVFSDCSSLKTIDFPASLETIGNSTVVSCSSLTSLVFRATTPPTATADPLGGNLPEDCEIIVPAASLSAYRGATGWRVHASQIKASTEF